MERENMFMYIYLRNKLRGNLKWFRFFRSFYHRLIIPVLCGIYHLLWIFPISTSKIVVCNFFGEGFGCNPKYIVKCMLDDNCKYDIVWAVKNMSSPFPVGVRTVRYDSLKYYYELATARVWIDNQHKKIFLRKRKGQFFLNTWHGALGLKKIGYDNPQNRTGQYEHDAEIQSKMTDLMNSNSTFATDLYRRVFGYEGEIIEKGLPRNDVLINKNLNRRSRIRGKMGIHPETKMAIYAPTFRETYSLESYTLDLEGLVNELEKITKYTWVVLVRLHPLLVSKMNFIEYNEKIINGSLYSDMQDIMLAGDFLITDYSNVMFEFALTGYPVILFSLDYEEYKKEREFYFDYFSLPFSVAQSNEELVSVVRNFDKKEYEQKLKEYFASVGLNETGQAARYMCNKIHEAMKKKL